MVKEKVEKVSLQALAERISQCANEADARIIEAAQLIREARARIESGEIGEVTWYEWAPKNIDLKETRLRELQRIAEADDPQQELERQRKLIRARVEKHREKKKAQQPPAPLRNGGERPTEAIVQPQEGRQRSSSDGQDRDEDHHMKPKAAAPLRNGGAKVKAVGEPGDQRQHLLAWAQAAPLEHVRQVLSYIQGLDSSQSDCNSGEPAAPAAA